MYLFITNSDIIIYVAYFIIIIILRLNHIKHQLIMLVCIW